MADDLIPRALLFGDPEHARVTISPDGGRVAFLAPVDGALQLFVRTIEHREPTRLTDFGGAGVRDYHWMPASDRLVLVSDADGDENWQVRTVSASGGPTTVLVADPGVQAILHRPSRQRPDRVLVGLNDRDPRHHDLVSVGLDGSRERVFENDRFAAVLADRVHEPRYGIVQTDDGGMEIFERRGDEWRLDAVIAQADAVLTGPRVCTEDGDVWYWLDSRGRDTGALVAVQRNGTRTVLAAFEGADVDDLSAHPATGVAQVATATRVWREHIVIDEAIAPALERLRAHHHGELSILSRSDDDARWVVHWAVADGPSRYALYETATGGITELFLDRPALDGLPLRPLEGHEIETRDGLSMVSYLTRPPGPGPHPLVLSVHGGPWARTEPGYLPLHQLFANRGYAVLAPNFRGSTGFGKAFVNAADHEWAGKMHDDLLDAVDWAIAQGITTRDQVAITGGSYGGYATLVGLTFTPEVFACGIDIVGPSNLLTLFGSIPPYWAPMRGLLLSRVGDDTTEEGRAELWARSPLSRVDALRRPLLIGQGANDPRVKQAEAEQIVGALRARDIDVKYALFPDEGHGFAREVNRLAFMALAETFLAQHLGGRAEKLGDVVEASSMILT